MSIWSRKENVLYDKKKYSSHGDVFASFMKKESIVVLEEGSQNEIFFEINGKVRIGRMEEGGKPVDITIDTILLFEAIEEYKKNHSIVDEENKYMYTVLGSGPLAEEIV